MSEPLRDCWNRIVGLTRAIRFRSRDRVARWRRAWRYAFNGMSTDDAQWIIIDCEYTAGWHPLLTLTVEDTLEQALEDFDAHPELPRLIADGCARVKRKWESPGDLRWEAQRWAVDLALQYAHDEGIALTKRSEAADFSAE